MIEHVQTPAPAGRVRLLLRRTAGIAVGASLIVLSSAMPALADTPQDWTDEPAMSWFGFLVIALFIPVAMAIVIGLLAYAPTLIKGDDNATVGNWRGEGEWVGGPTQGINQAEETDSAQLGSSRKATGGASGNW